MKNENDLDLLVENFFDEYYYYFSSFATLRGIHRYDYKLSAYDRNELNNLRNLINDTTISLKSFEERNKNQRTHDLKTFKKILENTLGFIDEGFFGNAQFFVFDAFLGIVSVALTQAKPMSIRSRNFAERLGTLKHINDYIRTYVINITDAERKAVLKEIDYLEYFINQFSTYLLTKSDTDKKENLKVEKTNAIETLTELRKLIKSIKTCTEIKLKGFLDFHNLDNSFVDLKRILEDTLTSTSENLIRKAREIKIANPYKETIKEIISTKEQFDETRVNDIINSVENTLRIPILPEKIEFERRIFIDSSEFPDILSSLMGHAIPSGEFDLKKNVLFIIRNEENYHMLVYKILSNLLLGKPFVNFYRVGIKGKKKYFLNYLLYNGLPVYLRRTIFDEIKSQFGRAFELIYYYEEYVSTLKAYIQNEIYFRNWDILNIENFINEDKILIDKERFMEEFIYDMGRSFLTAQGLNAIVELKKEKRLRPNEFIIKLLQNMHYPFSIIRQLIK
ncbi:hypothetical protein [Caldisericum exile]|uniref:Uncharacterized protein n=1 Tax=Caldisericum exile (strain DSM 21853 / NBRC 104410 / AZM16c01) TaxID=511051 RepID=A0A7U6GEH5_CALEA|nr:hypothetical protein [Caldisericum exile]BAL80891.1 hypothetical protein CSE_07650 [Caldisericum exile AZM16c01]